MNEVVIASEPKTAQMEGLVTITDDQCVTTSLKVAEYFGRDHNYVMQSVEKALARVSQFYGTPPDNCSLEHGESCMMIRKAFYVNEQNGQTYDCYEMNRDGFMYLVMGFTGKKASDLKLRFMDAFNRMEKALKAQKEAQERRDMPMVPQTFAQALRLAAEQQEQIEAQQKELEQKEQMLICQQSEIAGLNEAVTEMKGKVSYLDRILACTDTVLTTVIAQDYGMSAIKFNLMLKAKKIQHKIGKSWVINAKFLGDNLVKDVSFTYKDTSGKEHVTCNTQWTQKGRMWLYERLKADGVLPMCEQVAMVPVMA